MLPSKFISNFVPWISDFAFCNSASELGWGDFTGKSSTFTMFSSFFVPSAMTFDSPGSPSLFPNIRHGSYALSGEFGGEFFVSVFGGMAVVSAGGFSIGFGALSSVPIGLFVFVAGAAVGVGGAGVVKFSVNVLSIVFVGVVSAVAGASPVGAVASVALGGALVSAVACCCCCFVGAVSKFGIVATAAASWPARVWV